MDIKTNMRSINFLFVLLLIGYIYIYFLLSVHLDFILAFNLVHSFLPYRCVVLIMLFIFFLVFFITDLLFPFFIF